MSESKAGTKTESRAVALARAHLEAWTNHDFDTARGNLAKDVQFSSLAPQPIWWASTSTWMPRGA